MGAPPSSAAPGQLARVVGVPGAVLLGLGSILGTGIFVSVGLAAEAAGPAVVIAVVLAAAVATFNGLSSAQLAASHPVSGGTYEYGQRYLSPGLGFAAGWMFVCAKSASAATAALGLAGYALAAMGLEAGGSARSALGVLAVGLLTAVVAGGMRRSNRANAAIVTLTLLALGAFVAGAAPAAARAGAEPFRPLLGGEEGARGLLRATALLFVAYTGYGRIATLGEEVRDPARSIPRAIVLTLLATMAIYAAVVAAAVGAVGAPALAAATRASAAPLELVARELGLAALEPLLALGAITAMAGVLLNLLLGISRVGLAMARRGDAPAALARVDAQSSSPRAAVLATGAAIALLTAAGSVATTWSFSAFTVLVYYALTNLAALRQPAAERRFPRAVALLGLGSCLGLAFLIEPGVQAAGIALLAAGFAARAIARRRRR